MTRILLVLLAVAISVQGRGRAYAGGGPENVLLLVNANSESSKTIANHYVALRKIPPDNVVYLDWKGNLESGSGENLREKILRPALQAVDERKLLPQIDYIIYSSDFPWRFELKPAFPAGTEFTRPFEGPISTTGATYLLSFLFRQDRGIVNPDTNWYVPGPRGLNEGKCAQLANVPSRGFRSRYLWDPEGKRVTASTGGQRYMLSTMLGVTQGRGNTVAEVISYLQRSAAADGTRPNGTIYFMWNKDIRSAARDKCFESVAAQINTTAAGVRAKVQQGVLPDGAKDVSGLMVGTAFFDLKKSAITIRPGAICDNLTSNGGVLLNIKDQTPLTEFLRHGAAGASGTVFEPYAIQAKFPLPSLQLHYARGCSLAESFYQSISGPYQILIVGDPLCQPWATPPKVAVAGIKANDIVKGTLTVTPSTLPARPVRSVEAFVDGKLFATQSLGKPFTIDTTTLPDGYHELRIVAIEASSIETQGRVIVPFYVNNQDVQLQFKASSHEVKFIGKLRLTVRQEGAESITIRQNHRVLASVKGEGGEVEIAASRIGRGPALLQAFSEGPTKAVSAPVRVVID